MRIEQNTGTMGGGGGRMKSHRAYFARQNVLEPGTVIQVCDPSTQEAEAGELP